MVFAAWVGLALLVLAAPLASCTCTGKASITGIDSGNIVPGTGPFSGACTFEIKPGFQLSDPQRIVIGVRTWDSANKFTLSVYDGQPTDADALLYSVTQGSARPLEVRARLHSLATVVFTPDAATTDTSLEVYFYTSTLCSNSETPMLTAQEGTLGSGPGPYKNTMLCNWVVAPSSIPSGSKLRFQMTMLDTHASDAWVRLLDASDNKLAEYWGVSPPQQEITCPTSSCKVAWHTGDVAHANTHTGFGMTYRVSSGTTPTPSPTAVPAGGDWWIYVVVFVSVLVVLMLIALCLICRSGACRRTARAPAVSVCYPQRPTRLHDITRDWRLKVKSQRRYNAYKNALQPGATRRNPILPHFNPILTPYNALPRVRTVFPRCNI
ncbi:hypothetical protein PAPYR_2875 [Paratrimastix pyriformis]|uniref:CUB domain-containing protein n=1 Tax=Paratrimastix pyriformis TaxID=342808 RepID=A0ABQ8UQA0_9EUKA|nr:hypothetical protein PAPYR_2875 [Paratrimastix pyriformis]